MTPPPPNGAKKRILVVEDDPSIQKVVRFRLEHEGFSVSAAWDGEEALEKVHADPVDLVLMDVRMPRMNGYELCRRLRNQAETVGLPLIIMSGTEGEIMHLADRCIEAGANDWIQKPFRTEDLLRKIERLLKRMEGSSGG